MFCGRPSGCPSVYTYFAWRDISSLSEEISTKLAINIYHVSGNCWQGFQGQRSKVKVICVQMCEWCNCGGIHFDDVASRLTGLCLIVAIYQPICMQIYDNIVIIMMSSSNDDAVEANTFLHAYVSVQTGRCRYQLVRRVVWIPRHERLWDRRRQGQSVHLSNIQSYSSHKSNLLLRTNSRGSSRKRQHLLASLVNVRVTPVLRRGATTAKKFRGTKVWVPTPGRCIFFNFLTFSGKECRAIVVKKISCCHKYTGRAFRLKFGPWPNLISPRKPMCIYNNKRIYFYNIVQIFRICLHGVTQCKDIPSLRMPQKQMLHYCCPAV